MSWPAPPRLADALLAFMLIEGLGLSLYAAWRRRRLTVPVIWGMLLPGAFLAWAGRVALGGGHAAAVMLLLSAALIAHLSDLRSRWDATRPAAQRQAQWRRGLEPK